MNMAELIRKKRDGSTWSTAEIVAVIQGYTAGEVPDYQMAAWAMAIYFQGLNDEETAALTMAMVESGQQVDLSSISGKKVDKHSTGGVGDTTTLIVAPLVASVGVPVAKLSGRGLGHTGGTLDKLESIPGLSTSLKPSQFIQQVNRDGIAIAGQTADLTPADKKLYALRDVTATIDSIPLIASSIMCKKIAAGADAIVLDVKTGKGAFMKDEAAAIKLAQAMVGIGERVGRETVAVISDMEQPLGQAIGNALEVREAIQVLQGKGPEDLTQLSLVLGAHMVLLAGYATTFTEAQDQLKKNLYNGSALHKFQTLIESQGGDPEVVQDLERLPKAKHQRVITASAEGWINEIQAEEIGICALELGAGRKIKDAPIDPAAGIFLHKKIGDAVQKGEPLATLYTNNPKTMEVVSKRLLQAILISSAPPHSTPLIRATVTKNRIEKHI